MSANRLPLSIRTAMQRFPVFYRKVWTACARIPAGKTMTYGELARKIGHPGAARAVGQALARNPFAPTVPCHRVIGADGSMTGFSGPGGITKKRRMLEREKAARRKRG